MWRSEVKYESAITFEKPIIDGARCKDKNQDKNNLTTSDPKKDTSHTPRTTRKNIEREKGVRDNITERIKV